MNAKELQRRHLLKGEPVVLFGEANGDLLVKIGDQLLYDSKNEKIKRFRSPETTMAFVESLGVFIYEVNLKMWDRTQIFDRHQRATELRNAAY